VTVLKYYIAAQVMMIIVWFFAPASLPTWVFWLPLLTLVLHVGIVVGIAIVGLILIGILGRQWRKDHNHKEAQ
jgi:hypothetical protein